MAAIRSQKLSHLKSGDGELGEKSNRFESIQPKKVPNTTEKRHSVTAECHKSYDLTWDLLALTCLVLTPVTRDLLKVKT